MFTNVNMILFHYIALINYVKMLSLITCSSYMLSWKVKIYFQLIVECFSTTILQMQLCKEHTLKHIAHFICLLYVDLFLKISLDLFVTI